jgi:hypothetical protein
MFSSWHASTKPDTGVVADAKNTAQPPQENRLEIVSIADVHREIASQDWSTLVQKIEADIFHQKIAGLLLRWQSHVFGPKDAYSSVALAQYLRERAKRSLVKDIPIILCIDKSTSMAHYQRMAPAQGLFDMVYEEEEIPAKKQEFLALAEGYRNLSGLQQLGIGALLGVDEDFISFLDSRFVECFRQIVSQPSHAVAHFLLRHLLEPEGLLVEEDVLGARLGVEMNSEGWGRLKSMLEGCRYRGVFGTGWTRWWWHLVENWWDEHIVDKWMKPMGAQERVTLLRGKTGLRLQAAVCMPYHSDDRFWTVCSKYRKPLASSDGLIAAHGLAHPWEAISYYSVLACKNGEVGEHDLSTHEHSRLACLINPSS